MRIGRLGIIYGSYMLVVHTFSSCSSGILEQPVSEAMDSTKWTNRTACSFPWLKSQNSFICVDICSLLFVLQKSVTSKTSKNKHWMDTRQSVRHLEISSGSGSHCSGVWHPCWCSRWTVEHFLLVLRRLSWKPCFRRPMLIKHLFFVLWCTEMGTFDVMYCKWCANDRVLQSIYNKIMHNQCEETWHCPVGPDKDLVNSNANHHGKARHNTESSTLWWNLSVEQTNIRIKCCCALLANT